MKLRLPRLRAPHLHLSHLHLHLPRLRRPRLERPARVAVLIVVAAVLVAGYAIGDRRAIVSQVEVDLTADQGRTDISLAVEQDPVSPGCGCHDPSFGALPWYGMAVPSQGFDLSVASQPSPDVDAHHWALEAMAPDQDVVDWFGVPTHSLRMKVLVNHDGHLRPIFDGRVSHFVLMTSRPVHVWQPKRYPYAAVLPAASGRTSFSSQAGARPGCCGSLKIDSHVPARASADSVLGHAYSAPSLTQRGPMIDVLGPTVSFGIEDAHVRLWAGVEPVHGLHDGDRIGIQVTTPYSLRLIPHPAQLDWVADVPGTWKRLLGAMRGGDKRAIAEAEQGPRAQGRFLLTEPLPAYSVRMGDVEVPADETWRRFARRSAARPDIKPFLSANAWDDAGFVTALYGLPPVSETPEVGVFGRVTALSSAAMRGQIVSGTKSTPIARGQQLSVSSAHGVDAGTYRFTPLVSAGVPAEETSISGRAKISIGGRPVTRVWWLPWLLGLIAAAIVSLLVEGLVTWVRHAQSEGAGN